MIRLVPARVFRELLADLAEADQAARTYEAEADRWNRLYVEECDRADAEAERADRLLAERDAALAELNEWRLVAGAAPVVPASPLDHQDQDARHAAAASAGAVLAARTSKETDQ
jgi:hypothetical protein